MRRRRFLVYALLSLLFAVLVVEGYRAYGFYDDLNASRHSLTLVKNDLDLTRLQDSPDEIRAKQDRLNSAAGHLDDAQSFMDGDPFVEVASHVPWFSKQVKGLKIAVRAGQEAALTGSKASDVALAYSSFDRDPKLTSIEQAVTFLQSQQTQMGEVEAGLRRLQADEAEMPNGLVPPLANAKDELHTALDKLDGLVTGYNRANAFLPGLLGYSSAKRYLLLPQNDTELFPSGGLISSYGIITFDKGRLTNISIEYFGTLYDRWQAETNEYVEPPAPLKNNLLLNFSWGLGEAGWYPDFPTTADLARDFVTKGGAPATDGTIAIDLQFTAALLELLGPVRVSEFNTTVTPENFNDTVLSLTRGETYVKGEPHQAFLSVLARTMLNQVFSLPKDKWVDLLRLFDRMGRERHLQLNFDDKNLQGLTTDYGFDGALLQPDGGDYLMIADASVKSTKLNLILQPSAAFNVALSTDGSATSKLLYNIDNPFPQWKQGRDPGLVEVLMLGGVYGCYLRVYSPQQSEMIDVKLGGQPAGAEENNVEMGKRVIGRFFPVLPGQSANSEVSYRTPGVVTQESSDRYSYRLYVQKEPGTRATPFEFRPTVPAGYKIVELWLDGKKVDGTVLKTDLRTDRQIEVIFSK